MKLYSISGMSIGTLAELLKKNKWDVLEISSESLSRYVDYDKMIIRSYTPTGKEVRREIVFNPKKSYTEVFYDISENYDEYHDDKEVSDMFKNLANIVRKEERSKFFSEIKKQKAMDLKIKPFRMTNAKLGRMSRGI